MTSNKDYRSPPLDRWIRAWGCKAQGDSDFLIAVECSTAD